jgi:hypothetical protein
MSSGTRTLGFFSLWFLHVLLRQNHLLDMASAIHPSNLANDQSAALLQAELAGFVSGDASDHGNPSHAYLDSQFDALLQA